MDSWACHDESHGLVFTTLCLFTGVHMSKMWFRVYWGAAGGEKVCMKCLLNTADQIKELFFKILTLDPVFICLDIILNSYADHQHRVSWHLGQKAPCKTQLFTITYKNNGNGNFLVTTFKMNIWFVSQISVFCYDKCIFLCYCKPM